MAIGDRTPVNIPAAGTFGAPPPNAPREVTGTDVPGPTADQVRRARANEKELEPLRFGTMTVVTPVVATITSKIAVPAPEPSPIILTDAPAAPAASSILAPPRNGPRSRLAAVAQRLIGRPPVTEATIDVRHTEGTGADGNRADDPVRGGADHPEAEIAAVAEPATEIAPPQPYQPAASNTDSPSRGVPTRSHDPGKTITGGFGDAGEAQYFPLDGTELRAMVCAQMDRLRDRLLDDLRFSMAITYPRVTARVVIEVDCFVSDASFTVPVVMPPHTKTPTAIAREHGDQVVFVVVDEVAEMTPDGESITPPNQVRSELGLEIPYKRFVQAGARRIMVDREI